MVNEEDRIRHRNNINSSEYAIITKIKRFAIHDGPGVRTTIFFKGCPLRCIWCSNPENLEANIELAYFDEECISCYRCVDACPYDAITPKGEKNRITIKRKICQKKCLNFQNNFHLSCTNSCNMNALQIVGEKISLNSLMSMIMKDRLIYHLSEGGVTASGGEPTCQGKFVSRLFEECKKNQINTALDTCGYTDWNNLDKVTENVDFVIYDIKFIDDRLHKKYTGVGNKIILRNAKLLSRKVANDKFQIIVRIPIIPGITNSETNIKGIADFVKSEMKASYVELLPYHRFGVAAYKTLGRKYGLSNVVPPSNKEMDNLRKLFSDRNLVVH
jgi:pyruvate formate lyase activating enzyme